MTSVAGCARCNWDPAEIDARPLTRFCLDCIDDFESTIINMHEADWGRSTDRRYLRRPGDRHDEDRAGTWWEAIGLYWRQPTRPTPFFYTPVGTMTGQPTGHYFQWWDIRQRWDDSPVYLQHRVRWRGKGRPAVELPVTVGGIVRGTKMTDVERALAALDLFDAALEREFVKRGRKPILEDPGSPYWEHIDAILQHRREGMNPGQIALRRGIGESTVRKYLGIYHRQNTMAQNGKT